MNGVQGPNQFDIPRGKRYVGTTDIRQLDIVQVEEGTQEVTRDIDAIVNQIAVGDNLDLPGTEYR
jgi:hypothetical protein